MCWGLIEFPLTKVEVDSTLPPTFVTYNINALLLAECARVEVQ